MFAIAKRFDLAAARYDTGASAQAEIAGRLVTWATPFAESAKDILDLGCGTGFVSAITRVIWPNANLHALDISPAMLEEARRKVPGLITIEGDAVLVPTSQLFDIVFSSMLLQWLEEPSAVLRRWQNLLKPEGRLYVALPVEGSFPEWADLCRAEGVNVGLWPLPSRTIAPSSAVRTDVQTLTITYPSARAFVQQLKDIGAATPRTGYTPMSISAMRRILQRAPVPFTATYQILYIEMQSAGNN